MAASYHVIKSGPHAGKSVHGIECFNELRSSYDKDVAGNIFNYFRGKYDFTHCEVDYVEYGEETTFTLAFYGLPGDLLNEEKQELQKYVEDLCSLRILFNDRKRSKEKLRGERQVAALCVHVSKKEVRTEPMQKYNPAVAASVKDKYLRNFQPSARPLKTTHRERARSKLSKMSFVRRVGLYLLGVRNEDDVVANGLEPGVDPDSLDF